MSFNWIKAEPLRGGPDTRQLRFFGLVVGGIFLLIGVWPPMMRGAPLRAWAVAVGSGLAVSALAWPGGLAPVHRGWMALGNALGWINTRILLTVVFYGLVTPMGVIRRVLRREDPLRRVLDPQAKTYRSERAARPRSHLRRQF